MGACCETRKPKKYGFDRNENYNINNTNLNEYHNNSNEAKINNNNCCISDCCGNTRNSTRINNNFNNEKNNNISNDVNINNDDCNYNNLHYNYNNIIVNPNNYNNNYNNYNEQNNEEKEKKKTHSKSIEYGYPNTDNYISRENNRISDAKEAKMRRLNSEEYPGFTNNLRLSSNTPPLRPLRRHSKFNNFNSSEQNYKQKVSDDSSNEYDGLRFSLQGQTTKNQKNNISDFNVINENQEDDSNYLNPYQKLSPNNFDRPNFISKKDTSNYIQEFKLNYQRKDSYNFLFHIADSLDKYKNNTLTKEEILAIKEKYMPQYIINWVQVVDKNTGLQSWKNCGKKYLTQMTSDLVSFKDFSPDRPIDPSEPFYRKRAWFFHFLLVTFSTQADENPLLIINRQNIIEDSFNQYMSKEINLAEPIKIYFVDEEATDEGGVYRDWYGSLFNALFKEENKFFRLNTNRCLERDTYIIHPKYKSMNVKYYEFIGKLMIKALIDLVNLRKKLNRILIMHLLNRPITLEDMKYYDLELYKTLKYIQDTKIKSNFDFNNTDAVALDMNFVWEIRDGDNNLQEVELIPNGKNICVSESNKNLFIEKVIYYVTYFPYQEQISEFKKGLMCLSDDKINKIFTIDEFNMMIYGFPNIDLNDWKENTEYKGEYNENHPLIVLFWEEMEKLNQMELEKFLEFSTGCSGVPVDGFCSLKGSGGKIQKFNIRPRICELDEPNAFKLIEAKTCFNSIILPNYKNREELAKALRIIIQNNTNYFGFE